MEEVSGSAVSCAETWNPVSVKTVITAKLNVIKIWKYMVENMGKVREDLGLFNQDFKF